MAVEAALREIDEAGVDAFDLRTRRQAVRKEGSRRNTYKKTLREVENAAGPDEMEELAIWIVEYVRTEAEFPSSERVRVRGARVVRESGHSVSSGSWLGA